MHKLFLTTRKERRGRFFKYWFLPAAFAAGVTLISFIVLRLLDFKLEAGTQSMWEVFFLADAEAQGDALGGVSEVLIAILGLVVTVVAIVVQLAAQRYTPKLIDLFIADKVNLSYFTLMVVSAMYSLLLVYSITPDFLPFSGSLFLLGLTTLILSLLIPYFNHVFLFLTPANIIAIIHSNAQHSLVRVFKNRQRREDIRKQQNEVANAMGQISDIALSAVSQMDRNLAVLSILTLKELMVDHLLVKGRMPKHWFSAQKDFFPALSTDFIKEIHATRVWVEVKGFMDLELIFKTAIKEMPDAASAVANSTKILGFYAIRLKDDQVLANVIQFFNTFLRLAVNSHNPRAISSLFYQYRMLAEEMLEIDPALVERIAFYFKYYGQIAHTYNIPMILVIACFDLAYLLQQAYAKQASNMSALLDIFLQLDDAVATQGNEFDLRSVRKAQLMLGSFLLSRGDEEIVTRIFEDMRDEPAARMRAIQQELLIVTDRKFWEVTDRGVDFFFMEDEQKKYLNLFFDRYFEPYYRSG